MLHSLSLLLGQPRESSLGNHPNTMKIQNLKESMKITLRRSEKRKKTMTLLIKADATVTLYAPIGTPTSRIKDFISRKTNWILSHQKKIHAERVLLPPKTFSPGETFPLIGEKVVLEHDPNLPEKTVKLTGSTLLMRAAPHKRMEKTLIDWYKKHAFEHLFERIRHFKLLMGLTPERVKISTARKRWGSCTPNNVLRFSWRIIFLEQALIDHIIIHEMAHIKEKNHSDRFWKIVEIFDADARANRQKIRNHAKIFMEF